MWSEIDVLGGEAPEIPKRIFDRVEKFMAKLDEIESVEDHG